MYTFFFILSIVVLIFYIHQYAPLQDEGYIRWFWFGYWPLNITMGIFFALGVIPYLGL